VPSTPHRRTETNPVSEKSCFLEYWTVDKVQRTVILNDIYHCQNPLESTTKYVPLSIHVLSCPLLSSSICFILYLVHFSFFSTIFIPSLVQLLCPNTAKRRGGCQTKGNTLVLRVGGCRDGLITSPISECEYSHTVHRRGFLCPKINGHEAQRNTNSQTSPSDQTSRSAIENTLQEMEISSTKEG
jgi:hypothetical protein